MSRFYLSKIGFYGSFLQRVTLDITHRLFIKLVLVHAMKFSSSTFLHCSLESTVVLRMCCVPDETEMICGASSHDRTKDGLLHTFLGGLLFLVPEPASPLL